MTRHQFVNQNDWRIQQLQYRGLDSETLDEILDKALERSTDRCISVLEPGLSGFVVLMVSYKQDGHPH